MINCKLQDQLGDAFSSLEQVVGPSGRIHVVVEVADDQRLRELQPHARALASLGPGAPVTLRVRKVVRWVME